MSQRYIEYNSNFEDVKWNVLSDPTRRKIIEILSSTDCIPSVLLKELQCSQPALSSHLRKLRDSRLVETQRKGQHIIYSLNIDEFRSVDKFIQKIPLPKKNIQNLDNKTFYFDFESEKSNKIQFVIKSEEITCEICNNQTCEHVFEILSNSKIREKITRRGIMINSDYEKYIIQLHQRQQSLRESIETVNQIKVNQKNEQ